MSSKLLFTGFQRVRVDSSLRLCLPADWRRHAWEHLYVILSRNNGHPVIKVITQEQFDEKMQVIMMSPNTPNQKYQLVAKLASLCRELTTDKRNRISIPPDLGEKLGLEKPGAVTLVGCGSHFEIWKPEEFEAFLEQELAGNGTRSVGAKHQGAADCLRPCGKRFAVYKNSLSLALHSDPPMSMGGQ